MPDCVKIFLLRFIWFSVPVDHTFFLGNFCTTSLASSMMASFVPKPVSINLPQGPNKGMVSGSVSEEQILTSTSYPTHPPGQQSVQQTSMYENSPRAINPTDKKLNGNLVPSPSLSKREKASLNSAICSSVSSFAISKAVVVLLWFHWHLTAVMRLVPIWNVWHPVLGL